MGCFQSKKEVIDLHPNVFRVINVDDNGSDLCSGQLEITETDIILYREGRDTTVWPLHSLRRYGFEGELFSFESGRRCDTGEGIYAFKCRRASILFRTLQQQIQLRNVVHEIVPYPVTGLSPLPHGRQTLQASVVHRSSIDNGQPDNFGAAVNNNHSHVSHSGAIRHLNHSPRSPSSADILEVMPLYPQSRTTSNHVTNVYQLRDFKREHNNNQSENERHDYTNDFNRDLAILRSTLRRETARNTMRDIADETRFLESRLINDSNAKKTENQPISPTLSSSSEHYAQLQQDGPRLYVNIASNDTKKEKKKIEIVPATPLAQKQDEYCNLSATNKSSEINTYANLMLSDKVDSPKGILVSSEHKYSESDTLTSMSPVEDPVNYAVLDIDSTKEAAKANRDISSPENVSYNSSKHESSISYTSQSRGRLISQNSNIEIIENVPAPVSSSSTSAAAIPAPSVSIGYTTIDFDKTVALTSVAAITDANIDGARKTRHNSSHLLCGSPSSAEKSRII